MTLTATQIQGLIVLEVGDTDAGLLTAYVALIWSRYADKAQVAPRLQELYTKRACIDVVLGSLREAVDFSTGDQVAVKLDQKSTHLTAMRKDAQAEIELLEQRARAGRIGVVGQLTTVAPIAPPTSLPIPEGPVPDGNSGRYGGSVYFPTRRV